MNELGQVTLEAISEDELKQLHNIDTAEHFQVVQQ
jgi:hypothetical protein